jgi:endoglucanase
MKSPLSPCRVFAAVCCSLLVASALAAPTAKFTFQRGVNISHWLSQNEGNHTYAAPWFGAGDVAWIAQQGFDHIRLPVDIRECLKPDGSLDPAKLKPIHECIGWAQARGLGLVLDAHFLPGADFNTQGGDKRVYTDAALMEKVAGIWRELAREFASEGQGVRFEILNEPVADENWQLNPFMHRMLAVIRESNPTRIVYVTSNRWSQFSTVPDVELPDDRNIALTIHDYEPLIFTHQRAPWVDLDQTLPPVHFPGTVPDYASHLTRPGAHNLGHPGDPLTEQQIDASFQKVADWVAKHRPGLEVYLGEFGVYQAADAQSKINWIHTVVRNCEERGWGWAVWDYNDSFGVRAPDGSGTPILAGLFPKK